MKHLISLSSAAALASFIGIAGCAMAQPMPPQPQCTAFGSGPIDITGQWQSNLGPIWLSQRGNRVSGQYYADRRGTLHGTLDGTTLDFNWSEPGMSPGTGRFVFCPDNLSFAGYWNETHPWSGLRMGAPPSPSATPEPAAPKTRAERGGETPWWAEPDPASDPGARPE